MTTGEVTSILNIAVSLVVTVVGFIYKQAVGRITDRIEKIEKDQAADRATLEAVRKATVEAAAKAHDEIDDLRRDKVDREDFIREASRNRITQEKLVEGLARLEGAISGCRDMRNQDQGE